MIGTARLMIIAAAAAASLFAAACGDDDTATSTPSPSATTNVTDLPILDPWELHVAAADGSGEHLVYVSENTMSAVLSPDGSEFALSETHPGTQFTTTLRIIGADGAERTRFEHGGYTNKYVWSPDGQSIVADFSQDASTDVIVAFDLGTGAQRDLMRAPNNTYVYLQGWLEGNEVRVIQGTNATSNGTFLAVNAKTGATRQLSDLTVIPNYYDDATISPDGKQIAVFAMSSSKPLCAPSDKSADVFTIDIASGQATQVTNDGFCGPFTLAWSGDGKSIAFLAASLGVTDTALRTVDVTTHQAQKLATGLYLPVAWPQGGPILTRKLACSGCDGGGPPKVTAIDPLTGAVQELSGAVGSAISLDGLIVTANGAIREIDGSGQPVATLAETEDGWQYNGLAWSADGKQVTYVRSLAQGDHVFDISSDGSGYGHIGSYAQEVRIAPDGSRVAYVQQDPTPDGKAAGSLWLANADGQGEQRVDVSGSVGGYAWSPDSSRIVFSVGSADSDSTYVVNKDGSGLRKVTGEIGFEKGVGGIIWAPNGKLVVFPGGPMKVLDVDTGDVRTVTPGSDKGLPAWSADSSHLIYTVFNSQGGSDIVVSAIDGSGSKTIPGDNRSLGGFAASPAGSKVAYLLASGDTGGLYIANADFTGQTLVMTGAAVMAGVQWSHGQWLALIASPEGGSSGLFVLHADGSGLKQLLRTRNVSSIAWAGNDRLRLTTFIGGL